MSLINIEKTIELDVYDHDTTPSVIKTIQMDTGTRTVFAVIQNSRQDYDIGQNATVSLTVLRPDKTKVQVTGQTFVCYTGSDGTMYGAKAELSDVALAVKGNLKAQFKITSGEQELRTEIFAINNGEALDVADGDWAGDLDGHNLDEMAESIETLQTDMAAVNEDVSDLKEGLSEVVQATRNLWNNGDVSIDSTGYSQFLLEKPLAAGTYTFSCECTSTYTGQTYSVVRFSRSQNASAMSSTDFIADVGILHDGTSRSATFTISETAYSVRFMSGENMRTSSGHTSEWKNIQVESGTDMTAYIRGTTATDYLVRESVIMPFTDNKPVNVLLFGVKNDGSEDIADLVNALTEDYPLYFPAGIYKVSKQIKLKNSIYGAGVSRFNRVDANYTWFVSDIDNPTTPLTSVFKIESNRTENISGINIMLNSYENGIDIYYTQIYTRINNINISNVRGLGIFGYRSSDQNTGSRLLFIDDVSIFGAADYPTISVGIKFSSQIGDCRITNTEIMGTKVGIDLGNGIIYMSDLHIWCGPLAGEDNNDWWSETVGIKCSEGNRLIATNLYLDTCHHGLELLGNGGNTNIQNLIYAEDSSVSNSSANDSVLIYTAENMTRVGINGGFVNFRPDCKLSALYNLDNPNLYLADLTVVGDYDINPSNAQKFAQEMRKSEYSLLIPDDNSGDYVEIFHVPVYNVDGMASVSFVYENGNACTMKVKTSGANVSFVMSNETSAEFYYKYTSADGLVVYQKDTRSTDVLINVCIDRFSYGFIPANYSLIRRRTPNADGNNEYVREVLSTASGLTQIT